MKVYKLFRIKNGKLYPLYVEANRSMPLGKWLNAGVGEKVDDTHVKARGCGNKLRLRSGFHSTTIPFTNWIGKRSPDGTLIQRKDTVWCECEIKGKEINSRTRYGYDIIPHGSYYYFKTNSKQKEPWIISHYLKINKILTSDDVCMICKRNGIDPQPTE